MTTLVWWGMYLREQGSALLGKRWDITSNLFDKLRLSTETTFVRGLLQQDNKPVFTTDRTSVKNSQSSKQNNQWNDSYSVIYAGTNRE